MGMEKRWSEKMDSSKGILSPDSSDLAVPGNGKVLLENKQDPASQKFEPFQTLKGML